MSRFGWPREPYRHNPDAPYRKDDIITLAREKGTPPCWEVLCVGKHTYYLKRLPDPDGRQYAYPEETIWTKWTCEQATVLRSRKDPPCPDPHSLSPSGSTSL